MTSLLDILKKKITENGPLSLEDYMREALLHPKFGYYQTGHTFGAKGDFVTSPEISQMFGELIGLWCVDCWIKLKSPSKFHLIELGPGNGTLMYDALRSAALAPDFLNAAEIHLVEASQHLTGIQKKNISGHSVNWSEEWPILEDNVPIIVIGNEFLDALPIRQFELKDKQWMERSVTLTDGELDFCLTDMPKSSVPINLPTPIDCAESSITEVNPGAELLISQIAKIISKKGGSALFIDYGPAESSLGDSFQSVKRHEYTNPLQDPGTSDLTAHVDFERLRFLADDKNCETAPIETQGRFLERLGIEARALILSRNADEKQKSQIASDMKRLVSTEEMGTLFKAMTFYSNMAAPPAGFGI